MKKKTTRATSFAIAVIVIFSILLSRLFYIQLAKGDYYKTLAEEKGEKEIIDPAPRGKILDKNGKEIATSIQGYNITFSNYQGKTKEKKEVKDNRINKALIETIRIVTKNGNVDKLNLTSLPIVLEGDKYVYNFTATSEELRAKLTKNLKKAHGIDKIEEKEIKATGNKNINYDINRVVEEIGIRFGVINKDTKKYNYDITKAEMLQLLALRTAISEVAYSQYKTVYIAKNVSQQTAFSIMTKSSELPGISYEVAPIRHYPYGEVGSAFIGYLGKIGEDVAEKYKGLGYDVNRELIGKLGLEKALESNKDLGINLRGEPGVRYVNVDRYGQILSETATLDPIPGDTVKTTIDMDLQKAAEDALDKTMADIRGKAKGGNAQRGAAIVTDVKTGGILALASRPGYDPNLFAETGSLADPEMYKKYFVPEKNEGDKYDVIPAPMFNYVTKGAVPPGSILKPFVGIAGLEEGLVTPSETILDTGKYQGIKSDAYKCWIYNTKRQTHGHVNISTAIETSCNIYFFEVGKRLGYEKFNKWTAKFGLSPDPVTGERPKSGIEIEESPGEVGSEAGYKRTNLSIVMNEIIKEISMIDNGGYTITKGTEEYKTIENMLDTGEYDKAKLEAIGISNTKAQRIIRIKVNEFRTKSSSTGELLNLSIGQGSTLLTPLQMIGAMNTLLNDGKRYSTHLVDQVLNMDGTVKREIAPELLEEISIKPENKEAVLRGMSNVTSGEHGTAASTFAGFPIKTGGKTGSAQVGEVQKQNGRSATGWFMGFAPYDNPEISIIVVIYDAGSGSYTAPVARAVYEEYFKLNKDKKEDTSNQQQNTPNPTERAYTGN